MAKAKKPIKVKFGKGVLCKDNQTPYAAGTVRGTNRRGMTACYEFSHKAVAMLLADDNIAEIIVIDADNTQSTITKNWVERMPPDVSLLVAAEVEVAQASAPKRRASGLTALQRQTLDRQYPSGWRIAAWQQPDILLEADSSALGSHENVNLFGGAHFVVNRQHVILSRRGKFVGYYAWGGRQYPVNGGRRPWAALVSGPELSGHYGDHRVPPAGTILAGRGNIRV